MPTVAEQLRAAREAQNLNLHQVAELTKIKTDHIRALEEGNFERFTAPVYIRGFVRTYASVLKLDLLKISADLEAELRQTPRFREPSPLTPVPHTPIDYLMLRVSRMNWRIAAAVIVLALVVVLVMVGFRGKGDKKPDPLKKLGPGLYQAKDDQSGELLPLPNAPPRRP
jgi:cytoskeletal protein RodZ